MYTETPLSPAPQDFSRLGVDVHDNAQTQRQRITVTGEMDTVSAPAVHKAVIELLRRRRPTRIEIDLRSVTFLDSAGIRTLVMCHSDALRVDCRLVVVDPHPFVHNVLQITGLLDYFGLPEQQATTGR